MAELLEAGTILVVDDHVLLGQALAIALARAGIDVEVTDEMSAEAILDATARCGADVVVLDLYGPEGSTLGAIGPLVTRGARVVVLTGSERPGDVASCLEAGANVVLHKGSSLRDTVQVVGRVARGEDVLSAGDRAELIAAGRDEAQAPQQRDRAPGSAHRARAPGSSTR